jgi:hypothetical protein
MKFYGFKNKRDVFPRRPPMLLGSLIIVMVLNFHPLQLLIASDGSPGSVPSYVEGDTATKWTIDMTSDTARKEGENKIIFEGSVALTRDNTTFYADKVTMEVSDLPGRISRVEMTGKVRMTKPGLTIHSQRAESDNFGLYIDFREATLTPGGPVINKARYWFDSGKILYEWENDPSIRGGLSNVECPPSLEQICMTQNSN